MSRPIRLSRVEVTYGRSDPVLKLSELQLEPGKIMVVAGSSGAGKSTLGHAAAGLLPFLGASVRGTIAFGEEGFALSDRKAWQKVRGSLVRWIPQEPARAFTSTRPLLPQMLEGVPDGEGMSSQLARLIKALGLPPAEELAHRFPFEMSGGMLQRAAVISAFLPGPELVVADEPTAFLDPPRTLLLARIVSALARNISSSVLWVTHDLRLAAAVADSLVLLDKGQIQAIGPPQRLLDPFAADVSPLVSASARLAMPV